MSLLRACLLATSSAALAVSIAAPAYAQEKSYAFDIAAQPLEGALVELTDETGLQLIYSSDLTRGLRSGGVKGTMSAEAALQRILAGTGLTFRVTGSGAITVERVSTAGNADGELVTGVVSVEGYQGSPYLGGAGVAAGVNGINGSRDITATEGTGSFTSGALTIGSKVPQALKDVPQSISVLTSERMEQQNVTDFTDAMRQLSGVTLVQGTSSLENMFYSRGFKITSIQVDGGAPLSTSFGFYPQIDMSIYDHVELLRGAVGQFGSYGDPGGTVNLVRKKPLDHAQVSFEAQVGSWQSYRVVADATTPLALDGKMRGRLVMTYQNNHYFYDTAKDDKALVYGIVELDLTPTTLVTAGVSHATQDSVPWTNGLPRYWNGDDLALPRSTSFVLPWNRWDFDTTEIFGGIEQRVGEDWALKFGLTSNRQSSTRKLGFSSGAVSPITLAGPGLNGLYYDYESKQLSVEATLSGAFNLFGQRQEVIFGTNRVKTDGGGQNSYISLINPTPATPYQPYPGGPVFCAGVSCPSGSIASYPPIDVFDFDPTDPIYGEPGDTLPSARYPESGQTQTGAYINLHLTAFDRFHLTTGLRWSRYEYVLETDYLCTGTTGSCSGMQIGDAYFTDFRSYRDDDISWPPPVSLAFDVSKSVTAYVGYTDIYQSQANYLGHDRNALPPVTGSNWEGGVKWAANDGKLNLSLALYRLRKKGFGIVDPPDYSGYEEIGNGVTCCYVADPDALQISKGVDFEAGGEILPGWQVSASYTYSDNRQEGSYFGVPDDGPRTPFSSIQPKNLYKFWTSYDFSESDNRILSGLTLSLGVNGQSSAYYSGMICTGDYYAPYPAFPTYKTCTVPEESYAFTVPGYVVFGGRVDYRFSETWSLAVNFDNIFDKSYYQTVGQTPAGGNWYGAPRSVTAALRAIW